MQKFNPLAATLIIAAATATVGAYCYFFPERAIETIVIYLATIVFIPLLVLIIAWIQKNKTSNLIKPEVAENLNTEMIIWTDDFSYVFLNKKLRTLLGISENDSNKKAAVWKAFGINAPDSKGFEKIVGSKSYETKFKNANGTMTSIAWSTSLVKKSKKRCLYLSTGFNLTEIKKMKVNLASANDFFNSSMELAEIGIIISTDRKKYIASSELMRMLGLKSNILSLNDFRALVHPNDRIAFDSAIKSASSEIKSIEMRIKSADTSYHWYSYRYKSIKGTDNTLPLFGGALLDSTQEHEKDALIERLAYIDEVTEIANRNKLINAGQEIYETCRLLNYSYWIIVLDIDRFHIINDTCGYNNGNYVLRNFAHILYKFVTPGGLAARISGDNFALILRDYGSDELPVRTVKSIQEEFAKLAVDELASINLSCSSGYSKMPEDGKSFLEVIEHAEFALKTGGVNQSSIHAYEPSMHDSIISTTEMEKAIALALDNNEFSLYYQPKIDLSNGRLMGVEALIRWIKPDGTVVPPDAFVPVAERSRLIGRITEFVLNEGCRQNVLWQKMGFPKIVMSINFTSSDFYQNDLKDRVLDSLIKSGLDPQWLEIELTESLALNDIDFAVAQMNRLRELGVKLAMDDFGTGYSSLSYLQTLPITLLKLDRSFITDIEHNNIAYEIVASVIRIAKSKKIETIAEGIENTVQQSILRMAGCDYAQGFLYGKPMPPEQLQRFFEQNISDLR